VSNGVSPLICYLFIVTVTVKVTVIAQGQTFILILMVLSGRFASSLNRFASLIGTLRPGERERHRNIQSATAVPFLDW
jgi:hypothetical protein